MKSTGRFPFPRAVITLLAVLFFADTALIIASGTFTLGTFLMAMITVCLVFLSARYSDVSELTRKGAGRVLKNVFLVCLAAYIFFLGFIMIHGKTDTDYTEDVIIVLGGGINRDGTPSHQLANRLDGCVEYCKQNPDVCIIVTGGYSKAGKVTEGSSMADYLVEKGIDPSQILVEDSSFSTRENFENVRALMDEKNISCNNGIVFVTSNYHVYRASEYARQTGFENVHKISVPTDLRTVIPSLLRESCADAAMLAFGY